MARSRVYRHNVRCPDCCSNWMRMDGFSNGRPAYRCGKRNSSCFTHSAAALPTTLTLWREAGCGTRLR